MTQIGTTGNDDLVSTGNSDEIFGFAGEIIYGDPFLKGALFAPDDNSQELSMGRGGDDHIVGGHDANAIVGDAGIISDHGKGGNDHIVGGGGGPNFLYGDSDNGMFGYAQGGNDLIVGGLGFNLIIGDSYSMSDHARGGNDLLIGGTSGDEIDGDAAFFGGLSGNAHGGNDVLIGGAGDDTALGDGDLYDHAVGGNDVLYGGTGNDELSGDGFINGFADAGGGNDLVFGGEGNDVLYGEGGQLAGGRCGNDRLEGGQGNDVLYGDIRNISDPLHHNIQICGADTLIGGTGNDQLWGDANFAVSDLSIVTRGADRFVFANHSGHDTIGDFETDKDVIDLRGFAGIHSFAQIAGHTSQVGADAVIDLGAAAHGAASVDILTLTAVNQAGLSAADFMV